MDYLTYLKNALKKETAADAATASDARSALEETLSALGGSGAVKTGLPDAEYERKTYDAPTDEKIAALAEAALTEYKQLGESAINSEAENNTAAKVAAIENEKKAAEKTSAKLGDEYASAVTAFENDAIKRGVARSSIAANNSAAIRSAAATAAAANALETENNIKTLENEIAQLEAGRKTALDNFNITYAAKLTEKINGLAAERDAKQAEVLEYNNALAQKELDAAYEKAGLESKLYSDSLSQTEKEKELASGVSQTVYQAKYEAIEAYLASMPASAAKSAVLGDTLIRDNLSDYYYYKIYNAYVAGK